jgi:hypothetical protein
MSKNKMVKRANDLIDEALELQNDGRHDEAFALLDQAEILLDNAEA